MLVCDDVQASLTSPQKVNVYGLLNTIRSTGKEPSFPLQHSFCVYLAITGGRGSGEGRIVVMDAETEQVTFSGQGHIIEFDADPLKVLGAIFRLGACPFPRPGLVLGGVPI
jgi:hypothetical protein